MEVAKGANSVVEFGPGYSTFAFIEAGVKEIVGLEHDDKWFDKQTERFKDYPQVSIKRYWNEAPVARVPKDVSNRRFDIAFVDSPKGYFSARVIHPGQEDCSRLNTCLAALALAPVVYLHDALRPLERGTLGYLHRIGFKYDWVATSAKEWKDRKGAKDETYGIARITNGKNPSGVSISNA